MLKKIAAAARQVVASAISMPMSWVVIAPHLTRNPSIRELVHLSARRFQGAYLYCNVGSEKYIVSSEDHVIGANLYVQGEFDFAKFERALELIERMEGQKIIELFDVGANVGCIAIPAVNRGLVSRAIAFEPNPLNSRLLRVNVALNDLVERIVVHECALGDGASAEVQLEIAKSNFGDHRVRTTEKEGAMGEQDRSVIAVASRTLDDLYQSPGLRSTLVWMDVQGYEGVVLSGARSWLQLGVPFCIEFWPYGLKRTASFGRVKQAFESYAGYIDLSDAAGAFKGIETLDELYSELGEEGRFTDLLFLSGSPRSIANAR